MSIKVGDFDSVCNNAINGGLEYRNDRIGAGALNNYALFVGLLNTCKEARDMFERAYKWGFYDFIDEVDHRGLSDQCMNRDRNYDEVFSTETMRAISSCIAYAHVNGIKCVTYRILFSALVGYEDQENQVYIQYLIESICGVNDATSFDGYVDVYDEVENSEDRSTFGNCENGDTDISNNVDGRIKLLNKYGYNMCEVCKSKGFDNVTMRDTEVDSVIEILGRRNKANPCLIGEPGVGKTSVVYGLVQRIVSGDVPKYLKDKQVFSIDISAVVSGTRYRGDFEDRLNNILYAASECENVILFFDEFHMLMGAGSNGDGGMSANNILKPAIEGAIKIIGATTTKEYAKFVEKDPAFDRRMQTVLVNEPSNGVAIKMIRGAASAYEKYHSCSIPSVAIKEAVNLSSRYINSSRLPDKAITVIDETAARVKARSSKNENVVIKVSDIQETVSKLTGINVNDLTETEFKRVKRLNVELGKHVIGQRCAIDGVCSAIKRSKAGVNDPNKPISSFLFVGPTGVGKTELTKVLSNTLGGSGNSLVRFDMSEYMEKYSASKLIGAAPGYVGFGDGGQLTEAVRHNPNCVLLFDEIEKAHHDIFNMLLQILDDGVLTDSCGRQVKFNNCIIVMTSNAGYGFKGNKQSIGFGETRTDGSVTEDDMKSALEKTFKPEFLNRIDKIIQFNQLTYDDCASIAKLELNKVTNRLKSKNITLNFDESVISHIVDIGYDEKYGARNIKRSIQDNVEYLIADAIISGKIKPKERYAISYSKKSNKLKINEATNSRVLVEVVSDNE